MSGQFLDCPDKKSAIQDLFRFSNQALRSHSLDTSLKWPERRSQRSLAASFALPTSSYGDSRYLWGLSDSSRTCRISDVLEESSREILVIMNIIAMGKKHKVRIMFMRYLLY